MDSNGVVTMTGDSDVPNFSGFLPDDKKTIVGTQTHERNGDVQVSLAIMQFTGQTYTADALSETWFAHMLNTMPSWIHFTAAVANDGVISFSHWVSSYSESSGPSTKGSRRGFVPWADVGRWKVHGDYTDADRRRHLCAQCIHEVEKPDRLRPRPHAGAGPYSTA